MFDDKKEDWKDNLTDEAQEVLARLLESARKHKCAYCSAEDVKTAQLWSALVEIKKELDGTTDLLKKVEAPFRTIIEVGEEEKKKTIEKLVTDMIKPADETTQEATKKLVESLMKF